MGTINERMFHLLELENYNQKELALYLGVDESTLSSWKRRGTDPPSNTIVKLAEFFQVPVRYLVEGDLKLSDIIDMRYSPEEGDQALLSRAELSLALRYRQLDPHYQEMILAIMDIAEQQMAGADTPPEPPQQA